MAWLLPSCLSVAASEVSRLESRSHDPTLAFFVTSNKTLLQRHASWRGWKTRSYRHLLFRRAISVSASGMRSIIKLIASQPGFHANRFPSRAPGKLHQTHVGYGTISPEPLARLGHDADGYFWKTLKGCLWEDLLLQRFSEALPKSGSLTSSGLVLERPMWAPRTREKEYLSWPDPVASPNTNRSYRQTPSAATPLWPTPAARDYKGTNSQRHCETAKGRAHMDQLPNFVKYGSLHLDQRIRPGPQSSRETLHLNPRFVEHLMGVPLGLTDPTVPIVSGRRVMESFLYSARRLLLNLAGGLK